MCLILWTYAKIRNLSHGRQADCGDIMYGVALLLRNPKYCFRYNRFSKNGSRNGSEEGLEDIWYAFSDNGRIDG